VAAALRLPVAWLPGRSSVHGALAAAQLRRRPRQHAGAALVLTLAAAAAMFATLGVTADLAAGQPPLWIALDVGLVAGGAGGLLLALAGLGLHFRTAIRRRMLEYAGLFAHGLPPAEASRSLRGEQMATAGAGLITGCVLGVALAIAVLPAPAPLGVPAALAAAGALAVAVVVTAALARRVPADVDPLRLQREP